MDHLQILYICFRFCPQLKGFLIQVYMIISVVIGRIIDSNTLSALFGVFSRVSPLSPSQRNSLSFMTNIERRGILLTWKSPRPPLLHIGLKICSTFLNLRKLGFHYRVLVINLCKLCNHYNVLLDNLIFYPRLVSFLWSPLKLQ